MLFNSESYIFIFLPIVFLSFSLLRRYQNNLAATLLLAAASLTFYTLWNPLYSLLLLGSVIANYLLSQSFRPTSKPPKRHRRKIVLWAGIILNIAPLLYFKYLNFFKENINHIVSVSFEIETLALPLAISFFTFQQISYLVDCYRGHLPERSFHHYCLYVTFFPQLIAGPIVRHHQLGPQVHSLHTETAPSPLYHCGISLISIGLFKKVVVADNIAPVVDAGYAVANSLSQIEAWLVTLGFSLQIYYDFSGYSDIAIGSALLFGITLPKNFGSPYKSTNVQIFWKRWHITLSNFLFEYIYKPLGGSRTTESLIAINIIITFSLSGLWHGAGWTFIAWGAVHGIALILYREWSKLKIDLPKACSWSLTFLFLNLTWVLFRAQNLSEANSVIGTLFGFSSIENNSAFGSALRAQDQYSIIANSSLGPTTSVLPYELFLALGLVLIPFKNAYQVSARDNRPGFLSKILTGTIFGISMYFLFSQNGKAFIYFNF